MTINFDSPEWAKLTKWLHAEVARLRVKNDAMGLSAEETAAIRGEIRLAKRICDLPNQAARNVEASPDE